MMRLSICIVFALFVLSVHGGQTYRRNLLNTFIDCPGGCTDTFTIEEHFPTRNAYMRIWMDAYALSAPLFGFITPTGTSTIYNPNSRPGTPCAENIKMPSPMLFADDSPTPANTCWRTEMKPVTAFTGIVSAQFSDDGNWGLSATEQVDQAIFTIPQYEIVFNYNDAFTGGDPIVVGFNGETIEVESFSGAVLNLFSTPMMQVNAKLGGSDRLYYKQLSMSGAGAENHLIVDVTGDSTLVSIVDNDGAVVSELLSGDYASLDEESTCQVQRVDSEHELFDEVNMGYLPENTVTQRAISRVIVSCMAHEYVIEINDVAGEEKRIDLHTTSVEGSEFLDGLVGQTHHRAARFESLAPAHFIVLSGEILGGDYKFNHFQ